MKALTRDDAAKIASLIDATKENLARIEAILKPPEDADEEDLEIFNPLNKSGKFLSLRGIEVCYRLFDQGKSVYAVAKALRISYMAANHRFYSWQKLGRKDRPKQPLD